MVVNVMFFVYLCVWVGEYMWVCTITLINGTLFRTLWQQAVLYVSVIMAILYLKRPPLHPGAPCGSRRFSTGKVVFSGPSWSRIFTGNRK